MNRKEATKEVCKSKKEKALIKFIIVFTIVIGFIIIFLTGTSIAFKGTENIVKVSSEREALAATKILVEKDSNGYWNIKADKYSGKIGEDSDIAHDSYLKVLQLTDIHFGGGIFSINNDKKTIVGIQKMIEWSRPDLIIITGDAVYPVPYTSGSINNKKSIKNFASLMNSFKIPWAFIYGNHDTEAYAVGSKNEISKILEENSYNGKDKFCLFQKGPEFKKTVGEIPQGNYPILIRDKNTDELKHVIMMMDSNKYNKESEGPPLFKYDYIHEDQANWYKETIKKLSLDNGYTLGSPVTSSLYIHIPLKQYREAWLAVIANSKQKTDKDINNPLSSNVRYFGGDMQEYTRKGENNVLVSSSSINGPIWKAMLDMKSTKFVFCGHDHDNNFSVELDGIRLTYGKSMDYQAYPSIAKRTFQRGSSVILLTGEQGENAINLYQKKLARIGEGDGLSEYNSVKTGKVEDVYLNTPNPKMMNPMKKIKLEIGLIFGAIILLIALRITFKAIKKKKA